jgi:hypothetical protein
VAAETHRSINPVQIPKRLVIPRESKARNPCPPHILLCLEAAAGLDPALFINTNPGYPGGWPAEGYDGLACDRPCPKPALLSHMRILVDVAQSVRACANPAMVIDLA